MEISINKALQQVKLLDQRIDKNINNLNAADIFSKGKFESFKGDKAGFLAQAASDYTSILQLIDNRAAIRSAINTSNAMTSTKFFDKTYTVFELIELKKTLEYHQRLIRHIKSETNNSVESASYINESVDSNIQSLITQRQNSSGAVPKDFIEATTNTMRQLNGAEAVTPLIDQALNLENQVDEYLSEIDFTLTEINATTFIEID